jgi:hypothetical protein
MNEKTSTYLQGMQAVNNFFEMLYTAMLAAMPGATFSKSGAWVWRAYKIDSYKQLAKGQYYCHISTGNPNILIFKESYYNPHYQSIDPRDEKYKIKDGSYYHPFRITLNLYQSRFFLLNTSEQYQLLENFVAYAAEQALLWQTSQARARPEVTSPEFIYGKQQRPFPHNKRRDYQQVSIEYLEAFSLQEKLLTNLKKVLEKKAPQIVGRDIEWLRENANWHNWDFRGWRLKFQGLTPGASTDYVWEIHYTEPERLVCCAYNEGSRNRIGYFDIQATKHFDLADEQQTDELDKFITRMLGMS